MSQDINSLRLDYKLKPKQEGELRDWFLVETDFFSQLCASLWHMFLPAPNKDSNGLTVLECPTACGLWAQYIARQRASHSHSNHYLQCNFLPRSDLSCKHSNQSISNLIPSPINNMEALSFVKWLWQGWMDLYIYHTFQIIFFLLLYNIPLVRWKKIIPY